MAKVPCITKHHNYLYLSFLLTTCKQYFHIKHSPPYLPLQSLSHCHQSSHQTYIKRHNQLNKDTNRQKKSQAEVQTQLLTVLFALSFKWLYEFFFIAAAYIH
ncbi:MAG: hypothetical protein HFE68_01985 [Erysipelotrichaceae bacterium]|nr:hypothetical protein [Erysipelotrichaceae bacterium]